MIDYGVLKLTLLFDNGTMKWTKADDQALVAAVREGRSAEYISEHILPNRSVGALKVRKQRLCSKGLMDKRPLFSIQNVIAPQNHTTTRRNKRKLTRPQRVL